MRYPDWSSAYKGNLAWLPNHTIYLTKHGSHAYGTNIPGSDLRGVAIPPREALLGFLNPFEQAECKDPDLTVFSLVKFVRLAADCNPNCIEILFTESQDILQINDQGLLLRHIRDSFLSKRAKHTFSGYAVSQLKRIQRHYAWLKDPPKAPPSRATFGLPESTLIPADQLATAQASVTKVLDSWSWREFEHLDPSLRQALKDEFERKLFEITKWVGVEDKLFEVAAKESGVSANFLDVLRRERQYGAALKQWEGYQRWLRERNESRAELEAKFGYDTKHAMHLVRLLRMAREILTTGKVIVKRPDAEELLEIRRGAWEYEKLVEWAQRQDAELETLYKTSSLPDKPDMKALEKFVIERQERFLG